MGAGARAVESNFYRTKKKGDAHSPAVVAAAVVVVVAVAAASPSRSSYNGFSRYNFRIFFLSLPDNAAALIRESARRLVFLKRVESRRVGSLTLSPPSYFFSVEQD